MLQGVNYAVILFRTRSLNVDSSSFHKNKDYIRISSIGFVIDLKYVVDEMHFAQPGHIHLV